MRWSGRGAHNDVAVTVSFNTAFELGQFRVGEEFSPTAQINRGLRLVLRKLQRQ